MPVEKIPARADAYTPSARRDVGGYWPKPKADWRARRPALHGRVGSNYID
jgi:hypothetical protein